MDHGYPLLAAILLFLAAGVAAIAAARWLRLNPILGFFAAGIVIGPHGTGLLADSDAVHLLAELGVAFLLFDIGTHFSLRKVWQQRGDLFGLGSLQVAATTLLFGAGAWLLGLPPGAAFVVGAGLSLSSTAIVLRILTDRGELGGPVGRRAVAVLVFQDLFVVLLLVVVPALAPDQDASIATGVAIAIGKVALAFVLVTLAGRYLLNPAFRWITTQHSDELFTFSALGFVLLVAWATSLLGLSLPLGAFLAGLTLAESRFAPLVQTELAPFRSLLLSLFFISVGMSLEIETAVERPFALLGLAAAIVAGKAVVLYAAVRALRFGRGFAARLGTTLAQASEFAFVLFGAAAVFGLLESELVGLLGAAVGLTMAATPLLVRAGAAIALRLEDVPTPPTGGDASAPKKVVVIGFDEFARQVCRVICAAHVPYVAMTSDHDAVAEGRSLGFAVELGSVDRPRALAMASVGEAQAVIVAPLSAEIARLAVRRLREIDAGLPVFVATDDLRLFQELEAAGIRDVVVKSEPAAESLSRRVLEVAGIEEARIASAIETVFEGARLRLVAATA